MADICRHSKVAQLFYLLILFSGRVEIERHHIYSGCCYTISQVIVTAPQGCCVYTHKNSSSWFLQQYGNFNYLPLEIPLSI